MVQAIVRQKGCLSVHLIIVVVMYLAVALVPFTALADVPFSVALYYAPNPPLDQLQAFDIVVVEPDAVGAAPSSYRSAHSALFAYISVGEVHPDRSYYRKIDPAWLIGDNPAWKSRLVDLADPGWRAFFLDRVVEPLWAAGYRGFFLDTLDSYQLVQDKQRHPALQAGLVEVIRSIKQRHPDARLVLNRGFEILDQIKELTLAVAAESLFQNFDPSTGAYGEVKESDRQWLLERFAEVRRAGLPVIAIDYVDPKDRDLARKTAEKIMSFGFTPWVTDKDLASLGVGAVEVQPRTILGLYDGSEGSDPVYTNLHRFAVMPLNYLGYQVELHDVRQPLPDGILRGRYAGVLVWPNSDTSGIRQGLLPWLVRQRDHGLPLLFLDRFGVPPSLFAKSMGGVMIPVADRQDRLQIAVQDPIVGFEKTVVPRRDQAVALRFDRSEPLLVVKNSQGRQSEPVALTPWGGYALEPFCINELMNDHSRWVIDPFIFFSRALRIGDLPAPDTTTENGSRLLLTHIDADGFESMVERPGGPLAVTELRERILKKYRIPTTYSVITSTLGDRGVTQQQAQVYQSEAREVFKLPWIEAGSHTFSHPFYWQDTEQARQGYDARYLPIPGYTFNLVTEIPDSADFINKHLLPPGKQTKILQWSGDCAPDAKALELSYAAGLGNINGGYTLISKSNKTVTSVAPLGIAKGGWFQVFAPNQNENVYTNLWTGPFYGYRRVIETFELTDSPRRLKPINIYYHTYSVTKEAGRRALEDVYEWALAQQPHAVFTSDYVNKVLDFNRTVVARSGDGWLIRNRGELRQLRLPAGAGYPDLDASRNIVGFSEHTNQRYIHLGPGGEAFLQLTKTPPAIPWLVSLPARIERFKRTPDGMELSLTAHRDGTIRFGNAAGCRLISRGKPLPVIREGAQLSAPLSAGIHDVALVCQ